MVCAFHTFDELGVRVVNHLHYGVVVEDDHVRVAHNNKVDTIRVCLVKGCAYAERNK